jgi:glycosyltransferase involved in cell wall biosynthesis
MHVSVILTVYNEVAAVARLMASLAAQTRRPDEVVICDGGSTDGTAARLQELAAHYAAELPVVRLLVEPGANISQGRNAAIAAAGGPVVAVTDAGVRLDGAWLENLLAPWEEAGPEDEAVLAVAGFFVPDVAGVFQTAMAATVLPLREEINPERFLPSSRSVAFLKTTWVAAGGYPEWLDYCEDLLFDFAVNGLRPTASTAFVWSPNALVYFRPRESVGAFWTQYYRYARGDGKADLWRKRHALRYVIYLLILPALIGHGLFGFRAKWLGWVGLVVGGMLYCMRPWLRLTRLGRDLSPGARLAAGAWVPVLRAVGDLAKMVGYPVGWWWRLRHRPVAEQAPKRGTP